MKKKIPIILFLCLNLLFLAALKSFAQGTITSSGTYTNNISGDDCTPRVGSDYTYTYTAAVTGTHIFSLCGTTPAWDSYLYITTGSCSGTVVASNDDGTTGCTSGGTSGLSYISTALTAGTTYYVVIEPFYPNQADNTPFSLAVTIPPPAPTNDACSGATALTPGSTCTTTSGTTSGANDENLTGDCTTGTGTQNSVWYSFVATATTHTVTVVGATGFDAVVGALTTCAGTTRPTGGTCTDNTADAGTETLSLSGLTVGTTYFVEVYDYQGDASSTSNFTICVTAPSPPVNDACSGATTLTPGSSCITTSGTTSGANDENLAGDCAVGTQNSVWYKFVATATTHTVTVVGATGFDAVVGALTTCAGTTRPTGGTCTDASGSAGTETLSLSALTVGTTYFIQVYDYYGSTTSTSNFTICVTSPAAAPANDNCTGAIDFPTIPTDGTCVTVNYNTAGATQSQAACVGSGANDDVWFKFVAPATSLLSTVTATSGSTDNVHQVFSGTCGGTLTSVLCSDPETNTITGLTVGSTYYLRIHTYTSTVGTVSAGNICLKTSPPAPSNDNCTGAIDFPTIPTDGTCVTVNYNTTGATQSQAACTGSGANDDVWFKFVAPSTSLLSVVTATSGSTDNVHQVFSGTCGGTLTSVLCSDPETNTITGLTVGSTYYLRIHTYTSTVGTVSAGNICLKTPPPAPSNDNCTGAIDFPTIPTDGTCVTVNYNTANATQSQAACVGSGADDDVWFKFVAPSTSLLSVVTATSGSTDNVHQVFSGTCGGTLTSVLCSDPETNTITGLTVGSTYYLRIHTYTSTVGTVSAGNICLKTLPPNDNCSGAIDFPTIPTDGTCVTVNYNTAGATQSQAACVGSGADDDVWFKFVAPTTSLLSAVTTTSGNTDNVHQVFSGTCGGTLTSVLCSDPETGTITGLTVGNTYYLRIHTYTSTVGTVSAGNICLKTPPPTPANDNCSGAVVLTAYTESESCSPTAGTTSGATQSQTGCTGTADDDVWYSFVATATTHTVTFNTTADIVHQIFSGSCGGTLTALSSTSVSTCTDSPNNSTYTGLTIGQTYYVRVYTYSTGVTASFTVCVTSPGVINNNCTSSKSLCDNACTSGDGLYGVGVQELNATNGGCLTAFEVGASWYTFTPTSSGTIEFLITPNDATTDYDFAVWGPNIGCGSLATPLRCSYAAGGGTTGLTATATDLSETSAGDRYVKYLDVVAGEVYTLLVNNHSGNSTGFTMDFGGTATICGTPATPTLPSSAVTICKGQSTTVSVATGTNIEWYDAASGGNFVGSGTSITVSPNSTTTYYAQSTSQAAVNATGEVKSCRIAAGTVTVNLVPTPIATRTVDLTCTTTSSTLNATGLSAGTYTYNWATSDGTISGSNGNTTATVTAAGTYTLSVKSTPNGCLATSTVSVTNNSTQPNISAGSNKNITCTTTSVTLDGSSSTSGATFSWAGPSGFTSTSATPSASSGGTYTLTVTNPNNGCTNTATVSVSLNNTQPNASAGSDKTLNCTTTSVTLDGSSSTSGATFSWAGPSGFTSTSATPSASNSGTYTLTVTNPNNGCTNTATVSVSLNNTQPNASAGSNKTIDCTNPNATLDGSSSTSGATFSWAGPSGFSSTSATPSVSNGGTYTLTVTNPNNGCTNTASVSVSNASALPNASAGSNKTLTCTTTSATLDGSSSTSGATFSWAGPSGFTSTSATPSVSNGGTYTLTVTNPNNGCTNTATVSVSLNNTQPNASAGSDKTLTCTTTSVTLDGSSSTSGATFSWAGPSGFTSTSATPSASNSGTYTLTVTNPNNGCTNTATVSVSLNNTQPNVSAGSNKTLTCTTTSVTLDGSSSTAGATFSWTGPSGFTSTSATPSATNTGTYTLTVTNPNNGCTNTSTVSVSLNNTQPNANAGSSKTIDCASPNATLDGSSSTTGATFSWVGPSSFSSTSATPSVSNGGTYTLTVTDPNNGCTNTASVSVNASASLPNASAGATKTLTCSTTSVTLDGSSSTTDATFSWTGPSGFTSTSATPSVSNVGTYTLTVTNPNNGCTNTATVSVSLNNTQPNVSAGSNKTLTCTTTSVTLDGSSSTAGATFSWAGPSGFTSTSATPSATNSGTYTLTVTNPNNGCTNTATVSVSLNNTQPNVSAGSNKTLTCTTTSVTLDGSSSTAGATFSWAGPSGFTSTSATPSVSNGGTYTLTVTDPNNGCTNTATVSVSLNNTQPNASAGSNKTLTCSTTSVALDGSSSTAGATFSWAGPSGFTSTSATPSVSNGGTYTLTVTNPNNGCTNTATVSVSVSATQPNASAGGNKTLTCSTTSVTLDGSSSTAGATFSWTGPSGFTSTSATPSATNSGTYTLTVTDPNNGCSNTATVSVSLNNTQPNANAGSNKTLTCSTTSVTLDGSSSTAGATFSWAGPSGFTSTSATPSASNSGTYTLTVTNPNNGCTNTATVSVSLNNTPPNANAGGTRTLTCTTTSVTLDGSSSTAGATFSWAGPSGFTSTSATPNVSNSGTYTLTVTNPNNGCTNTATVSVSLNNTPPNANAGGIKTLTCTTTSVTLDGSSSTAGATFSWTGPSGFTSTSATPSATNSGAYTLTVTNPNNGCTASTSVSVSLNNTRPSLSTGPNKTITCANPSVTILSSSTTPGATFLWSGPGGLSSTNPTPTVNTTGSYTVVVTNPNNGCTSSASISVGLNQTLPNANAGADKAITCSVTSAVLNGSSTSTGVIFAWTGPGNYTSTLQSPTVSNSGTYILTVTDPINGCTATDAVLVTNSTSLPNMTVTSNTPCPGGTLNLTISGTITGLTYQWSGPNGFSSTQQNPSLANVTSANSGIYFVTITATNGCKTIKNINANIAGCCAAEAGNISVVNPNICSGDKLTVSTSIALPLLNYNFYYLLVNQSTGIIVEASPIITSTTPFTFNTTTPDNYIVYGYSVKNTGGSGITIIPGTTTISTLLANTTANGNNYSLPYCYDLSNANAVATIPAPFNVLSTVDNVFEGNQGGVSPYNYNSHTIVVAGGTPPYTYNWNTTNFVKPGIQEFYPPSTVTLPNGTIVNGPGTQINILYADNATWSVTVSDANGCTSTLLVFSNDDINGQENGKILDIDNYYIKGANNGNADGAVKICVSGGPVGCTPSFAWSGPTSWTGSAPASAPGSTSGITATGSCNAGTTLYNLTGLPTGWYSVTVTCGSQTTEGWYWVPKKRPGRGKSESAFIEAFPNPFDNYTNIGFVGSTTGLATINLYSIDGKLMAELYKGQIIENEPYTIKLDGTYLSSGVYLLQLQQIDGSIVTQKIVLSK